MENSKLISVLIPTLNEAENIQEILCQVIAELEKTNVSFEVIVIDDSSIDGTADLAQKTLGAKGKVLRRNAPRSLSLSIVDGIKEAAGEYILVMDADGSHPAKITPSFIDAINDGYDLIVGSRYIPGGGTENFPINRKIISRFACFLGRSVTSIKDNTSGYFCVKKSALDGIELKPYGFKIGLEIFVKANFKKTKEIPYIFANRKKGKSKLDKNITFSYLHHLFCLLNYKLKNAHKNI